jgi:hypothetical protein
MSFYHVIIATAPDEKWEMLYADLSMSELREKFVKRYKRGQSFLVNGRIIKPENLRSISIIETMDDEQAARKRVNLADLADIEEFNREGGVVFISPGRGHRPEHLADAGTNVTDLFLNSAPGAIAALFDTSKKVAIWTVGILGSLAATGLAKWLGWG